MLTVAAVIVVGVARGPASGLTAGAMIGFIFLTYRFLEPIAEFTEVLDQTQSAVAGLRRVLGVLDLPVGPPPPEDPRPLPAGPLDIDVRDVTFSYPTRGLAVEVDEAVLKHVSAHIPAGQQVALVGATGSGKTTLGRLIARFADPTIGEIRLGGVPLRRVGNDELRGAARRRVAGAVPVQRHDRRQRRVRPAGHVADGHGRPSSPVSTWGTGSTPCPTG